MYFVMLGYYSTQNLDYAVYLQWATLSAYFEERNEKH